MFEKIKVVMFMMGALFMLPSCDGIYDDPNDMPVEQTTDNSFSYIDATSYTTWNYINLEDGSIYALEYDDTVNIPKNWTFALHRYDCKTNSGKAIETEFSSISDFLSAFEAGSYHIPEDSAFKCDTIGEIIIDLSQMMSEIIIYAESEVNKELSKWLDVDTSVMPPIYTPSNKVYLLKLEDGSIAAIRFTGFSNPFYYDTKGYISFDYIYPIYSGE